MSHQATAWVLEVRVGDPTLKSLLMAIAHRADRSTWSCWPSLDCLAYDTEVSKRTIQRRLDELVALGFINIEKRRRPDGTQDNSLITITGGQIVTLCPPVDKNGVAGGQKTGSPVDTAVHLNKQEEQEEQESGVRAKKSQKDAPYSDDFEAIWQQYPRTRNTSKKDAWNFYRVMTDDKREMVRRAVPAFAAAMRAEGRTEDKILHMIRFLRNGVFETVAPAATSGSAAAKPDWHKTATREQWQKILTIWSSTNDWRATWGPAPGKPGCGVPEDMIAAHNLKHRGHMFSPEQLDAFRETASKHTVDNGRAA